MDEEKVIETWTIYWDTLSHVTPFPENTNLAKMNHIRSLIDSPGSLSTLEEFITWQKN